MPRTTHSDLLNARRIAMLGVTGAGKTTGARELAARLGVPAIDFDELRWCKTSVAPWTLRGPDADLQRQPRERDPSPGARLDPGVVGAHRPQPPRDCRGVGRGAHGYPPSS